MKLFGKKKLDLLGRNLFSESEQIIVVQAGQQ